MTSFKLGAHVWLLSNYPNLSQLAGCSSVVAAAFLVALPLGFLVLGLFLAFVGWVSDK